MLYFSGPRPSACWRANLSDPDKYWINRTQIVNTAPLNPINRKNLIWRWFHSFPLHFLTRGCKLKNTSMSSPIPVLGLGWSLSGGLHWLGTMFTFGLTGPVSLISLKKPWCMKNNWSNFGGVTLCVGKWWTEINRKAFPRSRKSCRPFKGIPQRPSGRAFLSASCNNQLP